MPEHKRKKRFVERHYKENPYCPQCGVMMVLPKDVPKLPNGRMKHAPNMATYEHTNSRINPDRGNDTQNKILCSKCNNENNKKDTSKYLTIEEIQLRAKRGYIEKVKKNGNIKRTTG